MKNIKDEEFKTNLNCQKCLMKEVRGHYKKVYENQIIFCSQLECKNWYERFDESRDNLIRRIGKRANTLFEKYYFTSEYSFFSWGHTPPILRYRFDQLIIGDKKDIERVINEENLHDIYREISEDQYDIDFEKAMN